MTDKNEAKKKNNKQQIIILLLLIVLLCAEAVVLVSLKNRKDRRSSQADAQLSEELDEEEQASESRITEYAEVKAAEAYAVLTTLNRGDRVELVGSCPENDDYYIVLTDYGCGMAEKRFLSTDEYAPWTGYAADGTAVYADAELLEYVCSLEKNTELRVIDDFGGIYLADTGNITGFVSANYISAEPIAEKESDNYGGNGNTGGNTSGGGDSSGEVIIGGGGGSGSGGTGGTGGDSGGSTGGGSQDGGDISLSFEAKAELMFLSYSAAQSTETKGTAAIRADGTQVLLAVLTRDDTVGVVSRENGLCVVEINGIQAYVEDYLLRFEGEARYEAWDGYLGEGRLYTDPELKKASDVQPEKNAQVTVLDSIDGRLLVCLGGNYYYTAEDNVSTAPTLTETYSAAGSSDSGNTGGNTSGGGDSSGEVIIGGGGGSGSGGTGGNSDGGSGSGNSGGGGTPSQEWSEPVL